MAKMGRPKQDEVKDRIITIRATPAEYEKMKQYAQSHNLTMTQIIRLALTKLIDM